MMKHYFDLLLLGLLAAVTFGYAALADAGAIGTNTYDFTTDGESVTTGTITHTFPGPPVTSGSFTYSQGNCSRRTLGDTSFLCAGGGAGFRPMTWGYTDSVTNSTYAALWAENALGASLLQGNFGRNRWAVPDGYDVIIKGMDVLSHSGTSTTWVSTEACQLTLSYSTVKAEMDDTTPATETTVDMFTIGGTGCTGCDVNAPGETARWTPGGGSLTLADGTFGVRPSFASGLGGSACTDAMYQLVMDVEVVADGDDTPLWAPLGQTAQSTTADNACNAFGPINANDGGLLRSACNHPAGFQIVPPTWKATLHSFTVSNVRNGDTGTDCVIQVFHRGENGTGDWTDPTVPANKVPALSDPNRICIGGGCDGTPLVSGDTATYTFATPLTFLEGDSFAWSFVEEDGSGTPENCQGVYGMGITADVTWQELN